VTDEEAGWDREARQVQGNPYSLKFWEFNADNGPMVIGRVCDYAMARAFGPGARVTLPGMTKVA